MAFALGSLTRFFSKALSKGDDSVIGVDIGGSSAKVV
jgi:hypothetical protein